jgi:hypothetical protein
VVFWFCPDGVGLHTDTDDAQALVAENCKSSQLLNSPKFFVLIKKILTSLLSDEASTCHCVLKIMFLSRGYP